MKKLKKSLTILFLAGTIFSGCKELSTDCPNLFEIRPPESELVWVGKLFSGGRQCNPFEEFNPPNTKCILNQAGIPVFDTEIEHHPVCAACICPSYAATHRALIKKEHLSLAEQLGFLPK